MTLVDALGWAGSALLVYSVLQSRMLRFRVLNLAASGALVVFNALIGVWPMVAMNIALCAINVWFVVSLLRRRSTGTAFEWVPAPVGDAFVGRFLAHHETDVAQFFPAVSALPAGRASQDVLCALVLHGDVTVGLVVAERATRPGEDDTWDLLVDYVIPGYRDYTAGSMIYSAAGPFAARGARRVVTGEVVTSVRPYLQRAGFTGGATGWARELGAPAPLAG
jgi:hypothetical protein